MSAHTPGPWEAKPLRIGAAITVYDKKDRPIATTCSNTTAATMEMHRAGEVQANARLIAAAPELLAALQEANQYINQLSRPVLKQKVADLIAKATDAA